MSYDRRLDQICPHMVLEEALFFNPDRQTVRPLRPIAAVSSVKVRYNGTDYVPSEGVYLPAQATGLKSAPFTIRGGVNDQLVIKVDDRQAQTLHLPSGNKISALSITDSLNNITRDALFSVTAKNQIRLVTSNTGMGSKIFIASTGSTGAATLGFSTNRGWQGRSTVPGWSIVNDPNTLSDRPTRLIVFDEPLKGFADYVEVNYTTIRQECRRCGGLGVENDWRYDGRGQLITAQNETLLIQEMLKATYTIQGSNPFHTWYGTNVVNSIASKQDAAGVSQNLIISEVYTAFQRWQQIKRQQEEDVGQVVTDEEYPFRITSVILQQSDQDPTVIFINATIQNRSSKPIQIDRGIRIPGPANILGSSQQQGFFQQPIPNNKLFGK